MTKKQEKTPEQIPPKPFLQGDMVTITGGIHKGKVGEVFNYQEYNYMHLFQVIISGRDLEWINQEHLSLMDVANGK